FPLAQCSMLFQHLREHARELQRLAASRSLHAFEQPTIVKAMRSLKCPGLGIEIHPSEAEQLAGAIPGQSIRHENQSEGRLDVSRDRPRIGGRERRLLSSSCDRSMNLWSHRGLRYQITLVSNFKEHAEQGIKIDFVLRGLPFPY